MNHNSIELNDKRWRAKTMEEALRRRTINSWLRKARREPTRVDQVTDWFHGAWTALIHQSLLGAAEDYDHAQRLLDSYAIRRARRTSDISRRVRHG